MFTHVGGANVSLRDVIIAHMGNGARECGWCHAPEARGGFWGFGKVSWVESCLGRRRLTFACLQKPGQWPCRGCHMCWWGGRWKSHHRKIVHLSYVETLNSKVIKGFVPELRSRYVFLVFRDSKVLCILLWTFYVRFIYSRMGMLHGL